jgi:hypothetical protein
MAVADIDTRPPEGVAEEAARGLEFRMREGGRGGTAIGVARARDLANRRSVSPETISRMVSFFARHEGSREIDPRFEGEPWRDRGYVAWLLWGGDAGRTWANKVMAQIEREREKGDEEPKADRLEQRDGEWCAVSEDGSRSFGCYPTEGEARERLRQVEAAKAARGDSVARIDRLGPIHTDATRTDGVLAELTPEGFLRCSALITRTGVFEYQDADGNTWGEYREAEEVFDGDSLDSFRMVVVTDDHPAAMVDSSNVRDVQVGHVGSDVRRDGDFVRASLTITDPEVIRSINDGKVELSCGYFAQVVQDPGVAPDGTPYTSRQTKIRGNHLALVDQGRAGPECRLQLDARDAITREDILMPKKQNTKRKDAKVIVGGVEFDVPDEVAEAMSEMSEKIEEQAAELAKLEEPAAEMPESEMSEGESMESEAVVEAEDGDKPEPAADAEHEAMKNDHLNAKLDTMQAKLDTLEAQLAESRSNEGQRIDARVNLVATCRRIIGDDLRTDGVSEVDLQKQVIAHCNPSMKAKLDGKSADYVRAAFEMALEHEASRVDSSSEILEATNPANMVRADGEELEAAHKAMLSRLSGKPAASEVH